MIEGLLDPNALPDKTSTVRLVQTHISSVLVADHFVYKVKKPVAFGFLDFSTLEKRRFYCQQEVRLNKRLSSDIYLGILPVFQERDRFRIGGEGGRIVDYAVRMRRIPEEKFMKIMLLEGRVTPNHMAAVARLLARFHAGAESSKDIDAFGRPEKFRINTDENFAQAEKYIGVTLPKADYVTLRRWTDDFYSRNKGLFHERIAKGKIRDCHGDLHMEHICLTDPVAAIDCIEFNDRFRYSDTVSDIAFLLMDLEYHGGGKLASYLWEVYVSESGDEEAEDLLIFYKVYRAFVRGKVISFRLDDDRVGKGDKERAAREGAAYFNLAVRYVRSHGDERLGN